MLLPKHRFLVSHSLYSKCPKMITPQNVLFAVARTALCGFESSRVTPWLQLAHIVESVASRFELELRGQVEHEKGIARTSMPLNLTFNRPQSEDSVCN